MSDFNKQYIILTAKRIKCLKNITGPVTSPVELSLLDVLELVESGFDVYEVNPYNKKERVKVTPYNYNSITFKTTLSDMIARKKLNREIQNIDKKSNKTSENNTKVEKVEHKKEEPKEIKIEFNEKNVSEDKNKYQKISHTDFEKH